MPKKKQGKKGKMDESHTPREDEVNNDIKPVAKQETNQDAHPTDANVSADVIEVAPKVEEVAPVVIEEKKEEPKPVEAVVVVEEKKVEPIRVESPKEGPKIVDVPKNEPAFNNISEILVKQEVLVSETSSQRVQEKKAEPILEANGESSGFVVLEKKEDQTAKPKEVEIKADHVAVKTVGIKAMNRDIHPEINSPFRRKKTAGGLKLSLIQEPESPVAEEAKEEDEHRFDQILPYWDQVLANLAISRQKFEDLKREPLQYHCKMYRDGEYKTLVTRWTATLELALPKGTSIDNETFTLFNLKVKDTLDDITHFINILHDWVESKTHQLEEEAPAELLEQAIEEAKEDDEHILEAERMGISSKNPQELKGLVREASMRVERGEAPLIKKQTSKSEKVVKEVEKQEDKKEESDDESHVTQYLVIGAAILVAAGFIAYRALKK